MQQVKLTPVNKTFPNLTGYVDSDHLFYVDPEDGKERVAVIKHDEDDRPYAILLGCVIYNIEILL